MHMADALLSPTAGSAFLALSGGLLGYSGHRVGREADERRVPLMGVLGAFVFAAQMINFSIPGTGSSGHLGGGMLLAILLGPHAAFLVVASVLVVQCLFFLDGGILALGTNIFNLGVWPCFLGLLVYRATAGRRPQRLRLWLAAVASVIVSLELGALSVVLQTLLSRRSDLPFGRFVALMMGIHLPIALVEGVVTAGVVQYVKALRPTVIGMTAVAGHTESSARGSRETLAPLLVSFLAMAILAGCVLAWFSSPRPDGLEWSLAGVQKGEGVAESSPLPLLERIQKSVALLPDYDFRSAGHESQEAPPTGSTEESWPNVRPGTSAAGLVGSALTLVVICLIVGALYLLRSRHNRPRA